MWIALAIPPAVLLLAILMQLLESALLGDEPLGAGRVRRAPRQFLRKHRPMIDGGLDQGRAPVRAESFGVVARRRGGSDGRWRASSAPM